MPGTDRICSIVFVYWTCHALWLPLVAPCESNNWPSRIVLSPVASNTVFYSKCYPATSTTCWCKMVSIDRDCTVFDNQGNGINSDSIPPPVTDKPHTVAYNMNLIIPHASRRAWTQARSSIHAYTWRVSDAFDKRTIVQYILRYSWLSNENKTYSNALKGCLSPRSSKCP